MDIKHFDTQSSNTTLSNKVESREAVLVWVAELQMTSSTAVPH